MSVMIGTWYPLSGQSLLLHLFPPAGGTALNGPTGSELQEANPADSPGFYSTPETSMAPGTYRARVSQSGSVVMDDWLVIPPQASLAVIGEHAALLDAPVSSRLSTAEFQGLIESTPAGYSRFQARVLELAPVPQANASSVTVTAFSESARQQLAGTVIQLHQPIWNGSGFNRPFVRGDSYIGELAVLLTLSHWPGPDLSVAQSITLTAVRLPLKESQFSWLGSAQNDGNLTTITWELSSTDTDQPAGLYAFDVEARWSNGLVHTIVGPDAPLRFLDGQTI